MSISIKNTLYLKLIKESAMKKVFPSTLKKSILIVGIFSLINCTGYQVTCPEFDEEILSWLPYQVDDVIELYSPSKDATIIFSIKNVVVTHKTHYTTGTDCGKCDDEILIRDYHGFQIEIQLRNNKVTNQVYRIGDTWFLDGNYTYSEIKNFLFEGEEYDVVRIFEKTDSEGSYKKLIIAKDIGIIGLVDIRGNIWVLKTNDNIQRLDESDEKEKNIVINNVSC